MNEKGRSEMCTMKRERGREKDGVYRGEKEEREERGRDGLLKGMKRWRE